MSIELSKLNPVHSNDVLENRTLGKTTKALRITMIQVPSISEEKTPTRTRFKSPNHEASLSRIVARINLLQKAASVYRELSLYDGQKATSATPINGRAYNERAQIYSKLSQEADELAQSIKKTLVKIYDSYDHLISETKSIPHPISRKLTKRPTLAPLYGRGYYTRS